MCERGGLESRTHEILKSFLGSPYHQHMLLSSLLHSFSTSAASTVTVPPNCGVKDNSILIQAPHRQSFLYTLVHSVG